MSLGLVEYLMPANAIVALVLCIFVVFDLVALWHQAKLGVDRKNLSFVLLVAFAAFALSAIAFLLMYYQIYSNAQAMVWAAFALSAALLALLAAFFTAFRRYVSVYLEDSGKKIPVFTIHEDDVRKKPGARAQKHYRRARK